MASTMINMLSYLPPYYKESPLRIQSSFIKNQSSKNQMLRKYIASMCMVLASYIPMIIHLAAG